MKGVVCGFTVLCMLSPASYAVELNKEFDLDMKFSLLSQYRTRGISENQNNPAVQFDGMLSSKSTGLYVGVFTASIDYGHGSPSRQELDYYAGWSIPLAKNVTLDLGQVQYTYVKESNKNTSETYASLAAYGFIFTAQYSDDFPALGKEQSTLYTWASYETEIPCGFKLMGRYGVMDYKDPFFISTDGSTRDGYHEWEVKLSRKFVGLDWAVSYVDTDLSKNECLFAVGYKDVCTAAAVFSVSKKI
ncbi:hypothetical protein JFU48_25055 [Pseudomonas sp. TH49]|uniref:TorF family putative porin n=1 Tax=Pseudomonas sp. TH49 TaxID=2796413 RepID=UPI001913B938|nr:TorF family putative porin [Pseudomonas sp. TH49]MBK5344642.1 hypothetical protein [Pseudomonas sp. TH49]